MVIVILSYGNALARDLVEERASKALRSFPADLIRKARMKLQQVHAARDLRDLTMPAGNRLEKLKGSRGGFHSLRINDQWRIVFRWESGNAYAVSIEDYHS